jgi:hypothetical protein
MEADAGGTTESDGRRAMSVEYRFEETIKMPRYLWTIFIGGTVSLLAGLVTPLLRGRLGWKTCLTSYPPMLGALTGLVFAMVTFRRLKTVVEDDRVEFGFGMLKQSLPLESITACEVKRYNALPFGGWGIRLSWGGRRAYSMLGVPRGVELTVEQDTKVRRYFVSSTRPELLASALSR